MPLNWHDIIAKLPCIKKYKQAENILKAIKRCGSAAIDSGAVPGAVVTLKVDYRTHSHAQSLIAIVYNVKKTGGILVCCDHGVITHSINQSKIIGCLWIDTEFLQERMRVVHSP